MLIVDSKTFALFQNAHSYFKCQLPIHLTIPKYSPNQQLATQLPVADLDADFKQPDAEGDADWKQSL